MQPVPRQEGLPPWRSLLRGARQREGRSPSGRWLQLATVATDGTPRVRTLVFRGWAAPAALDLLTDRRSAKSRELEALAVVEICWLLPKARCQFRLRGHRLALPPEIEKREMRRHWRQLTPSGRAPWSWPPPGEPLGTGADFPRECSNDQAVPEAFQLLRLELSQVEMLELGPHPHRRLRWRAAQGWQPESLNP